MSGHKPAHQSVAVALDDLMLDESWQSNLTDDERAELMEWACRYLSGQFESALQEVRRQLAEVNQIQDAGEQAMAILKLINSLGMSTDIRPGL